MIPSYLLIPSILMAQFTPNTQGPGYGPWEFGMSRDQVRAQVQYGPYYDFKNMDIGTKNGPFDNERSNVSFYFQNDKLQRIAIFTYMDSDYEGAKKAWKAAFIHIEKHFGGVEVGPLNSGRKTLSEAIFELEMSGIRNNSMNKIQMGATPMPKNKQIWCSLSKAENGLYFVSVNYATP